MKRLSPILAVIGIAAIALAACSGGGPQSNFPATPRQPALIAPVRSTSPQPAAASRTAVGTATLTIDLPRAVTGKSSQSIRVAASDKSKTSTRNPTYVNPTTGNLLDIFVDGSLIENLDGLVGNSHTLYVQSTANNGVQTISVPLFSTNTNEIVAVEFAGDGTSMLAVGNAYLGPFTGGTTVAVTLTMLMNAASIGILDLHNQADPTIMTTPNQPYYGLNASCGSSGINSQFGLYSADDLGTFVAAAGYGGTSTPMMIASPLPGSQTTVAQTTIPGVYYVAWDVPCNSVSVSASAVNPAYAIVQDEQFGAPIDSYGNSTYGYYDCHLGSGTCPGGSYQALWDYFQFYDESYYPQYLVNNATVTGSVVVSASPSPTPAP